MQPRTQPRQEEADEPRPSPSRVGGGFARQPAAAFAEWGIYLLAIVLVMWPALQHARHEMVGASDDARYYTWLGWRMGRLISHGHLVPTRAGDVIAPFGLDLRLLDGYLPSYVTGLYNLVVGPFLAYNLAFVTGAVLNVVAARSLARRVSPLRVVHVITAVAFLTAPPIALSVQVGALPLFWAFTVPLLIGDAIDVAGGARPVRPLRLVFLLVLAYLCSVYFLVFGGLAYGVIVGVAAVRRRSVRMPLVAGLAVLAALIVLLPFVVARFRFDRAEHRAGADTELLADSNLYSADALSIVAQPTRSTFLAPRPTIVERSLSRLPAPGFGLESTTFPGLLLLAGFLAFVFSRHSLRLPLALTAFVLWVAALGPSLKVGGHFVWKRASGPVSWLPYRLLLGVPGLGALRAPGRAAFALTAVLAAGTAITLTRVALRWKPGVLGLAAGALLATNLLIPLPTVTMNTTPASQHALERIAHVARAGDTVISVPFDCDPNFVSYQLIHRAPVVGCAGSFAANPFRSKMVAYTRSEALTKLRCNRAAYGRIPTLARKTTPFGPADIARLRRDFGVRFVVVERGALAGCPSVQHVLPFLEEFRHLGGDRRFEVLDLSSEARR